MIENTQAERAAIRQFVELILHGDEDHRQWLRLAGEQFVDHGTVYDRTPPPPMVEK